MERTEAIAQVEKDIAAQKDAEAWVKQQDLIVQACKLCVFQGLSPTDAVELLMRFQEELEEQGSPLMMGEVMNAITILLDNCETVETLLALSPREFAAEVLDTAATDLSETAAYLR